MAKVRTLSRQFLKGHPKAGQPTYFPEKVLNCLGINYRDMGYLAELIQLNKDKPAELITEFYTSLDSNVTEDKLHTIRQGQHFKTGDKVQLAVWTGEPYKSKQIRICPELEVVRTYDFETWRDKPVISVDGDEFKYCYIQIMANNDGLLWKDFSDWFKLPSDFKGQIICWNDPKY